MDWKTIEVGATNRWRRTAAPRSRFGWTVRIRCWIGMPACVPGGGRSPGRSVTMPVPGGSLTRGMTKSHVDKMKNRPGYGAVANDVEAAQEMILSFPDFVYPERCVHTIQEAGVPHQPRDRTGFPQWGFRAGLVRHRFGNFTVSGLLCQPVGPLYVRRHDLEAVHCRSWIETRGGGVIRKISVFPCSRATT